MVPSAHSWKQRGFKTSAAAAYIGLSPSWLRKKRLRGPNDPGDPGPRYRKTPDGIVLYTREDLDAWLDGRAAHQSHEQAA